MIQEEASLDKKENKLSSSSEFNVINGAHVIPPSPMLVNKRGIHNAVLTVSICCFLSLLLLFLLYQNYPKSVSNSNINVLMSKEVVACPGHSTLLNGERFPPPEPHNNRHAIILDAGSQGTRMHIYELEFCNNLLIAVHNDFFASVPVPLASLASTPHSFLIGAKIIDPLLDKALQLIPSREHSHTPVALRATAGLRLLTRKQVDDLLTGAKKALSKYPFLLVNGISKPNQSSVELIPGTSEGIWAWISFNFLYQNIKNDCLCLSEAEIASNSTKKERKPKIDGSTLTNSVLDMGGASLQVIAEISGEEAQLITRIDARLRSDAPDKEIPIFVHPVQFQGSLYVLFVHSFLGYGYQTVRSLVTLSVINSQLKTCFSLISKILPNNSTESSITGKNFPVIISHPCISKGVETYKSNTLIVSTNTSVSAYVTITSSSESSWGKCCALVTSIFDLESCEYPQCSFNGVPLPRSMLRKKNEIINLSSHFSVVLGPLLHLLPKYGVESRTSFLNPFNYPKRKITPNPFQDPSSFDYKDITLNDIERLGRISCSPFFTPLRYPDIFEAYESSDPSLIANLCLDLSYIFILFTQGFRVQKKNSGIILRVEREHIGNVFPCWTLGAAMHLLSTDENS